MVVETARASSSGSGPREMVQAAKAQIVTINANAEFRDDHFSAAVDRASDSKAVFTVAYVVRAVTPGKYVLPQAYVEDMYNPSRYGRTSTGFVEVRSAK